MWGQGRVIGVYIYKVCFNCFMLKFINLNKKLCYDYLYVENDRKSYLTNASVDNSTGLKRKTSKGRPLKGLQEVHKLISKCSVAFLLGYLKWHGLNFSKTNPLGESSTATLPTILRKDELELILRAYCHDNCIRFIDMVLLIS